MKLHKTIIIFIAVSFSCTESSMSLELLETEVDTKTIQFQYERLGDALLKAKESDKLIFTYVSSPYCRKCKQMERDIFTDTLVSNYLNTGFICASFKLKKSSFSAKSDEYKKLNQSLLDFMDAYDCKVSFPTFIIINASGGLVKKHTGSMTALELIRFAKTD